MAVNTPLHEHLSVSPGRKSGKTPELAKALRNARIAAGLTQEAAAELIGVSAMMISQYERGVHAPGIEVVQKMSEVYGVSVDRLLGLDRVSRPTIDVVREVPTRGYVSAGIPRETYEVELDPTPIPSDIAMEYPGAFVLIVSGDSLLGDGISDGDRVLIHPDAAYQAGRLFVVRLPDGEIAARHLFVEDGHIRLRAANDAYEDLTATGVQMLGRVVWHLRRM